MPAFERTSFDLRWPTTTEFNQLAQWLLYHFIASLLPIWGSALLLLLFRQKQSFTDYTSHGEFVLFGASLVGGMFYVLCRNGGGPSFPYRAWMILVNVVLIIVATLLFASVVLSTRLGSPSFPLKLNITMLSWLSLLIYFSALLISTIIELIQIQMANYDPRQAVAEEIDHLAQGVNDLKDDEK